MRPAFRKVLPSGGLLLPLFLLLGAAGAAHARPVRIVIEAPPGSPPAVMKVALRAVPQGVGRAAAPGAALEAELVPPGERVLELAGDQVWAVSGRVEGYWIADQIVPPGETPQTVTLRAFPAGGLTAKVEVPAHEPPPAEIEARFGPAVGVASVKGLPASTLRCPVREGEMRCVLPAGALDLRLSARPFAPIYLWRVRVDAGAVRKLDTLRFERGASISGRVVTEDGSPGAAGSRVELSRPGAAMGGELSTERRLQALSRETTVNEQGFFQLTGVPAGAYAIAVQQAGFAPARVFPIEVHEDLEAQLLEPIVLARPVSLRIGLQPPLDPYGQRWRVRLMQRDPRLGRPLNEVEADASAEGVWSRSDLAPGDYRLVVSAPDGSRWLDQELRVAAGLAPVVLEVPVLAVEGRVRSGEEALSGSLWFGGRDGARRVRLEADDEGEFEGFLPAAGTWDLEWLLMGDPKSRIALDPIEVNRANARRLEISIPDTLLAGEVVDEQGRRVPEAQLLLVRPERRAPSEYRADAEGEFQIRGLPLGQYGVQAEAGDASSEFVSVHLTEGSEPPRLRLVVQERREIAGRVHGGGGGVPGARVIAWPDLAAAPGAAMQETISGPDGGFRLRLGARATGLNLLVVAPGFAARLLRVALEPGRTLDIPLEPHCGTVVVTLPAATASSPPMPVPLLAHGGSFLPLPVWLRFLSGRRPTGGRIELPNVEAGEYALCAGPGAVAALRQGAEVPRPQCQSGFLAPFGELVLAPPVSEEAAPGLR